ncbi:MAG: hypothetical protein KJ609_21280 [Gammaproteobacteria bacterium]|uniref:hypothetical protein n=1 Tax=Marinomonas polaris TaxID=293552 RepID=UPI001D62E0A2|nr:hypothetical protein [Gammaproteobacteria bacterium]MBU1465715.1 hypothetical protein [Gammaproteobacteria bacterium]MBU2240450.1 hypothetical protein [Gammaproteobacteria bacterium]MBU2321082.1 hypothetical protein [Gammaproteobacteria bacterium]MBU2414699.1 hypothetical protein [Gammaproteobacteria bacterium]
MFNENLSHVFVKQYAELKALCYARLILDIEEIKMRAAFFIMVISLVSLTGCEINRVGGKFAGMDIEAKNSDSHSSKSNKESGSFCPPGQAKKGNC